MNDLAKSVHTNRAELAISAYLASGSWAQAASAAQVSLRTVTRWKTADWFQARLKQVAEELALAARQVGAAVLVESLCTLRELQDEKFPPQVRVLAASRAGELTLRIVEHAELKVRLDHLEEVLGARGGVLAVVPAPPAPWIDSSAGLEPEAP